jgi:UDP-sugar pyrophosphorylase
VHTLLHQHGLTTRWVKEGLKYVVFFQDTNPLIFRSLPVVLGVSRVNHLKVNSVAVPRKPGEAVGAIMKLKGARDMTINVEYNQLEALLAGFGGEAKNEQGYSLYPGNINVLVFELGDYASVLQATEGRIDEFINPKYKDAAKKEFKSPTRLECMMQDYPKLLESSKGVGFTQLPREYCFSAVKNDLATALAKLKDGLPTECAASCESDFYHLNRLMLQPRVQFPEVRTCEAGQLAMPLHPRVYLSPRFGLTHSEIQDKITGECVIEGELIVEDDVRIDGLVIKHGERVTLTKAGANRGTAPALVNALPDDP